MFQISRKAELATLNFKILITVSCLSLVVISWEAVEMKFSMGSYNFLLNASNVFVVIAYLLAGVFFMIWFYATYKQLYVESPEMLRYPPIWTVLGFSLPIANLYLPYVLVVNLWCRLMLVDPANSGECRSPRYLKIWWLSHLSVFIGMPAIYMAVLINVDHHELELAQFALSAAGYLLICNTARYAIRLVREINSLQN